MNTLTVRKTTSRQTVVRIGIAFSQETKTVSDWGQPKTSNYACVRSFFLILQQQTKLQ
ncbi:MAG: hypothetical protein IJP44_14945 [Bacteroidales bacterium]|nr:hypothetical protein [Bacteroidales bacterium]